MLEDSLLCWHYAQCFTPNQLCQKLCWHNGRRPTNDPGNARKLSTPSPSTIARWLKTCLQEAELTRRSLNPLQLEEQPVLRLPSQESQYQLFYKCQITPLKLQSKVLSLNARKQQQILIRESCTVFSCFKLTCWNWNRAFENVCNFRMALDM